MTDDDPRRFERDPDSRVLRDVLAAIPDLENEPGIVDADELLDVRFSARQWGKRNRTRKRKVPR